MDITGLGISIPAVTGNALVDTVSTEVLANSLDEERTLGSSMIKMMEQSVNPNLGSNVDIQA